MYQTEDHGLFIGLTTADYQNLQGFIDAEINQPFKEYREKIKSYCLDSSANSNEVESYFKHLYKPRTYGVFGSFDLMTLALVDDFAFATRYFHPFNSYLDQADYPGKNYTFHVISGLSPNLKFIDSKEKSLYERALDTFLSEQTDDFPFVGYLSLKLNNALLIGNGGNLIDLVLEKIQKILDPEKSPTISIILHSLSWNEISVLIFAKSYTPITKKFFEIRELSFGSLNKDSQLSDLYHKTKERSLLSYILAQENADSKIDHFEHTHLFVHTNSVFGYDINLLLENENPDIDLDEELNFLIRWDIKPGHLQSFQKDIEVNEDGFNTKLMTGRTDFAISVDGTNTLKKYRDIIRVSMQKSTQKHFRKISTVPAFPKIRPEEVGQYFSVDEQFLMHNNLDKFRFSLDQINTVRQMLKMLRFPMILQDKISKMFVIYNDGIHDPILYGYFIELRFFLNTIIETLYEHANGEEASETPVSEIVSSLQPWLEVFENAYKNRFGQSYIMNEITDFNLEFNGGIQQLISAYDGAYKSLTDLFGQDNNRSIVYISGEPNVESDQLSVRLNYLHLFQPEFFAAVATHEAANFLIDRTAENAVDDQEWQSTIDVYHKLKAKIDAIDSGPLDFAASYFLQDIITFYLAYNRNFELFFFWHWGCFLQTGVVYNANGRINQEHFDAFVARMLLINSYVFGNKANLGNEIIAPFTKYSNITQEVWEKAIFRIKPKVDDIIKTYKPYFDDVRYFTLQFMLQELDIENDESLEGLEQIYDEMFERPLNQLFMRRVYPELNLEIEKQEEEEHQKTYYRNFLTHSRIQLIETLSDKIKHEFKNAQVFNLDQIFKHTLLSRKVTSSFCYHALFYSYLTYIKELAGDNWALLAREPQSGKVVKRPTDNFLQIDPFGGIFSSNVQTRRLLLKARAIFLKSLWDFSTQEKINLFKE